MNYLYKTPSPQEYKAPAYRHLNCDINQAAKINGKLSLSLSHENHGYRLADNPPIYANDGKNVRLIEGVMNE